MVARAAVDWRRAVIKDLCCVGLGRFGALYLERKLVLMPYAPHFDPMYGS